jgi:glutathione S-transferase
MKLVIGNKNYSSWSLRPWLLLKQAELEFEEIRIPLYQPQTRHQLSQYSPSGKVPVLIHDQLVIWESIAICEYVVELAPDRHLLPADSAARAIVRAVSAEMHAGFPALRTHLPMDCRARRQINLLPEVQQNIDRVTSLWRDCRQRFGSNGDFLFGQFSFADAMFAPVVSRFVTYGVSLDPVSQAYVDALWQLPAMQSWLADAKLEAETIPDQILFPVD